MFRKLYTIYYWFDIQCTAQNFCNIWAKDDREALHIFRKDHTKFTIISINQNKEAVHKDDLKESIARYLIKPLNK